MFTWFDIIILTIITISSIMGGYKGIVKLIISLFGFIASIILTFYLYPYANKIITEYITNQVSVVIISGAGAYIISLVICNVLTSKLLLISSFISGGVIDKFLGLVAGILRGVVICLLIFLILAIFFSGSYLQAKTLEDVAQNTTINKYPEWLKDSESTVYLDNLIQYFIKILPNDTLKSIELPKKSEIVEITNALEKSHSKEESSDKESKLPEDFKQELDKALHEKNQQ